MKKVVMSLTFAAMMLSGCGNMSNMVKDGAIGAAGGAVLGAGIGALAGKDAKSAAIGAAIGTAVGTTAGAIIGKKMDKKAAELAAIEGASVETVTDVNDLTAVKVTFESGILFNTSSSTLSEASKKSLKEFATKMKDLPETDILIQGHTDHTGTREYNEKLSLERANSVFKYLKSCGMATDRVTTEGMAWDNMVVDTEKACAQNRRVEIYITANEEMIKEAELEAK